MEKTNNTQQASWIAIGSLFSFGFGIVSSMILSRYFLKEDYGTYKQVIYVYTTMLTVFTLGLPKAFSYFLPRVDENQAKSLIKKITNLFFLLGGIFSVILFFGSDYIAVFLRNPDLAYALKVFSPVPFLMLPTMGLEGVLATFRKTKFMALYTVTTRVMMLFCVAIPVMLFGGGYIEAIIGFSIASFVSFLLALYLKYYPVKDKGNDPTETSYKEIFKFSLPLLTASVWGILISSADQFFISRYFGSEVFAEFSNGALKLPFVAMIMGATSTVLSPVFSKMSHEKLDPQTEVLPLWKSVFEKSAMLIYPLLIYTWVFADVIMILLYGQQYKISSVYFRIFNTINFFDIIVFAPLLINTGKVRYYANVHMLIAVIVIILEYLSVLIFNSPFAISAVSLFCQLVKIYLLLRVVAKYFNVTMIQLFPLKLISKILLPSILLLGIEYHIFTKLLELNPFLTLILSFLIYIILFYFYSLRIELDYKSIVRPLTSKLKNK
ncbi:oligosaccharide flippase family protein [Winogradskyella sp. F6397]|uniref:Oligosaccharide flippase family protein n=1 Tax=Winogradskyella marina TaxID=2785530 RepID=A0ABS0EIM5_9FLAO|nr:oligosaccharide flippase family protein [Winogradskyella marina]MBF8148511.1 oligosaccharide flippase family protein [Winogradskyella marina]